MAREPQPMGLSAREHDRIELRCMVIVGSAFALATSLLILFY